MNILGVRYLHLWNILQGHGFSSSFKVSDVYTFRIYFFRVMGFPVKNFYNCSIYLYRDDVPESIPAFGLYLYICLTHLSSSIL